MHLSSHKTKIIKLVNSALKCNKDQLVKDFQEILIYSSSILNSNKFDFWLNQLKEIQINEIPITKYGLEEAILILKNLDNPSQQKLIASIFEICECLFTYSNCDDGCEMQGSYHSYYDETSERVFKESEYGNMVPKFDVIDKNKIRIAKISELTLNNDELI